MITSLFSSLPPNLQAQAAALFLDKYFGTDPNDYSYEIDAATGGLSGQRTRIILAAKNTGRIKEIKILTTNNLVLSDQAAGALARLVLPDFQTVPAQMDAPPVPLAVG